MKHKLSIQELIKLLEKERKQCEETLSLCKDAIEKKLTPQIVWLETKDKTEKRLKEIDDIVKRFTNKSNPKSS